MPKDVARLFQTSGEGGHAGPGSTWSYIHLIEEPLAHWARRARPDSWNPSVPNALDSVIFPDIGDGLLLPALKEPPSKQATPSLSSGFAALGQPVSIYREIAQRSAAGEGIEEIAGHCALETKQVLECIRAIARALVDAGLASEESLSTPSRQAYEIWRHRTWIAASRHAKLVPVAETLTKLVVNDRAGGATEVWNAWLRCVDGNDLSLDRSRPASILIRFLLKAGVPRVSLAITAGQQTLPPHLAEHKIKRRSCKPRPGTPKCRLTIVARHVESSAGKARQVSVKGLNWLFIVAGAAVMSKEV